jgi:hypothetical protein
MVLEERTKLDRSITDDSLDKRISGRAGSFYFCGDFVSGFQLVDADAGPGYAKPRGCGRVDQKLLRRSGASLPLDYEVRLVDFFNLTT